MGPTHRVAIVMTLAVAGWLAVPPARGEDGTLIGKRVVAVQPLLLRVGSRGVSDGGYFRVYTVERSRGGRLWLVADGVAGWAPAGAVVPLDRAMERYTQAIRTNPNSAAAHLNRSTLLAEKGEWDNALVDLNEAIRLAPRMAEAFYSRGCLLYRKKEYDKAIADFSEAIRLNPYFPPAFHSRGLVWEDKEEYDKAIADLDEAIGIDPRDAEFYYTRGRLLRDKKEYDKAIADLDEAIRLEPGHAQAISGRGVLWVDKEEYDKAIADLDEAIRLEPEYAPAYCGRGMAWVGKKEYWMAIADLDEAIELKSHYAPAFCERGMAWAGVKEYDRAIADLDEAIRLEPRDSRSLSFRAWLQATCPDDRYRDGRKAVTSATRACELTDWKEAGLIDTLAAAYAEAGDFDKAVEHQRKANGRRTKPNQRAEGEYRITLYLAGKPYREK